MILVTGATGNIGSALLEGLHRDGVRPVRGLTRDTARADFPDGVEAVRGDLSRPASLSGVFSGVEDLFLVTGVCTEAAVVRAARQAGVRRVVLVSSITVRTHPHLPAAQENLAVETSLRASGMEWTILRPTQFASNTLLWSRSVRDRAAVHAPYADTGLPTIHPADIADVARAVLREPGHAGRIYELTGPERISARQQTAAVAKAIGRELAFHEIGREEAHQQMTPHLGAQTAAAVLDLLGGDVNDELLEVRDTVERITGTAGRTFQQWAAENAAAFGAG